MADTPKIEPPDYECPHIVVRDHITEDASWVECIDCRDILPSQP